MVDYADKLGEAASAYERFAQRRHAEEARQACRLMARRSLRVGRCAMRRARSSHRRVRAAAVASRATADPDGSEPPRSPSASASRGGAS
jgi:hypothetical protein